MTIMHATPTDHSYSVTQSLTDKQQQGQKIKWVNIPN